MNHRVVNVWIYFISLNLLGYAFAQSGNPKYKHKNAKSTVYRVTTATPKLEVSRDGIFVTRLSAGQYANIETQSASTTLELSAPGYHPKVVHLHVNSRSAVFSLNLAKLPKKKKIEAYDPPSSESFYPIEKVPSICNRISTSRAEVKALCTARSLRDEIESFGPTYSQAEINTMKGPTKRELEALVVSLQTGYGGKELRAAEKIFGFAQNHRIAYEVAAHLNLLANNCPRAFSITNEARNLNLMSAKMMAIEGFCFEAQRNEKIARQRHKLAIRNAKVAQNLPGYYYNLARTVLVTNPSAAPKVTAACLLKSPVSILCQQTHLYLMSRSLNKKKVQKRIEKGVSKIERSLRGAFQTIAEKVNNQEYAETIQEVSKLETRAGKTFFSSWAKSLAYLGSNMLPEAQHAAKEANYLMPFARQSIKKLIPIVDTLETFDEATTFYQRLYDIHGHLLYFGWQLSKQHLKAKECNKVEVIINSYTQSQKFRKAPLFDIAGRCFLDRGDLPTAAEYFRLLTAERPKDWRSYYNLGEVFEKLNNPKMALDNYKESLSLKPPTSYQKNIKAKIDSMK